MEKKSAVFEQYVDQYLPKIEATLSELRNREHQLHIPYAQFLFSLIDYFGLLWNVAVNTKYNKRDTDNFTSFFSSQYFPSNVRCKSKFLYFIRNGIIHQIYPKATGVGISPKDQLFFVDENNVKCLNLRKLHDLVVDAYKQLISDFENTPKYIDNLHNLLIINNYGFDDHKEFQAEVAKSLGGDEQKIIDDCI